MYATAVIPALAVTIGRFYNDWSLLRDGERELATHIRLAQHPVATAESKRENRGFAALFARQNRRATIFASIPWFLQDLGPTVSGFLRRQFWPLRSEDVWITSVA